MFASSFNYKECMKIPICNDLDFQEEIDYLQISEKLSYTRAYNLVKITTDIRSVIPQYLNHLGLDEHSAMICANYFLDVITFCITGVFYQSTAHTYLNVGMNAGIHVLSTPMLHSIDKLLSLTTDFIHESMNTDSSLVFKIDHIVEYIETMSTALRKEIKYNPFYDESVYTRIKTKFTKNT